MSQRTVSANLARQVPTAPAERTAAGRTTRKTGRPHRYSPVDRGLVAAGLMGAVASCAFATSMIMQNTGPTVPRTNYFSVFAQLRGKPPGRHAAPTAASLNDDVDPMVTGSLRPRATAEAAKTPVGPDGPMLEGFSLREVFNSTALIDSPTGLQLVKQGAMLVGAGPVTAITRRGDHVVVTTPKGNVAADVE